MRELDLRKVDKIFVELSREILSENANKYAEGASMNDLEESAKKMGLELGRKMIELFMQNDSKVAETKNYPCIKCGKPIRILDEKRHKTFNSLVGKIEYERPYGVCDKCGVSFAPMDLELGIPAHGMSMGLKQRVCHAAVCCCSFESAAEIIKEHDNIEFSHKTVRITSEGVGKELIKERKEEIERYMNNKVINVNKLESTEFLKRFTAVSRPI